MSTSILDILRKSTDAYIRAKIVNSSLEDANVDDCAQKIFDHGYSVWIVNNRFVKISEPNLVIDSQKWVKDGKIQKLGELCDNLVFM